MHILKTLRHVLFRDRVADYLDSRRDLRAGYWLATESYLRRAESFGRPEDFLASLPPVARKRARAALSGYYQWLGRPDLLPAARRGRGRREPAGRILSLEELRAIVRAPPTRFGHIAAVLALTGCRRSEIGGLIVDSELRRDGPLGPRLELPPERTKQGRWHLVPVGELVCTLLVGHRPFSGWSKGLACHPVKGWTPHDLRRSAATHWGDMGFDADLIEVALGHRRPGVGGLYNRSVRWEERRVLMKRWEGLVAFSGEV